MTKNENKELMQIIYFDFDQFNLSEVSKDKIEKFYKVTKEANKIMQDWAHNQNTIFSNLNDLIK